MSSIVRRCIAAALLAAPAAVVAQQSDTTADTTRQRFEASLHWQTGDIALKNGLATVHLPAGYRYLGPEDASRVLRAWGNPETDGTLGMIFPATLGAVEHGTWGIVVQYDESGHVDDSDAATIDYTKLLADMQKAAERQSDERRQEGFATARLIGWAAPPLYDSTTHKLRWAKELAFSDRTNHTINWEIRVLGARGVLDLDAVGTKSQLDTLQSGMDDILAHVDFTNGNRYADYKPGVDRKAEYGIAALVAGGLLAKAGGFKLLLAGLLAMKKLIIVGVAAVANFFRKLFGKKKQVATAPPVAS